MTKLKSRKSIMNRFKITKNGKILRRASGLNHYRAKKSGQSVRQGRKWVKMARNETKAIKKIINA